MAKSRRLGALEPVSPKPCRHLSTVAEVMREMQVEFWLDGDHSFFGACGRCEIMIPLETSTELLQEA